MTKIITALPLALISFTLLTACADPHAFMPMPYKPADKGQNRIAQMILPDHIVVPSVRGLDEETGALITRAVIDDFLQKETIATASRPKGKTSSLYGEFVTKPDGSTSIRWTFRDPWGATLDDFETPVTANLADLVSGSTGAAQLAKNLAGTVTARVLGLRQPEPEQRLEPTGTGEKIIVTAIFDAPGDGDRFLRAAITASLRHAGFKVTDRPDAKTFRLQCTVGLTESRPGFVRLALTWELKSPQGIVLATIDQQNEISAETLKDGWSNLAPLVTQGAATGIADFFQKRRQES